MLYAVGQVTPQEPSILYMVLHKIKEPCTAKFITIRTDALFSMQMVRMLVAQGTKNRVVAVQAKHSNNSRNRRELLSWWIMMKRWLSWERGWRNWRHSRVNSSMINLWSTHELSRPFFINIQQLPAVIIKGVVCRKNPDMIIHAWIWYTMMI